MPEEKTGMKRAIIIQYESGHEVAYPWGSIVLEEIISAFDGGHLRGIKEVWVAHEFELLKTSIEIQTNG